MHLIIFILCVLVPMKHVPVKLRTQRALLKGGLARSAPPSKVSTYPLARHLSASDHVSGL
jgi:hypothetical protein